MTTQDEVRHELESRGLSRLVPFIPLLLHPIIRILVTGRGDEVWLGNPENHHFLKDAEPQAWLELWNKVQVGEVDPTPVGISKIGGWPDVWPGFEWPELDGQALPFLAQFRMEDVAPFDEEGLLPSQGVLLVFYDAMADWEEQRALRVLYFDGDLTTLQRAEIPENVTRWERGEPAYEAPLLLRFYRDWQLASSENLEFLSINQTLLADGEPQLSEEENEMYSNLWSQWSEKRQHESRHQLLGIPPAVYDDERLYAVCLQHNIPCNSSITPEQAELTSAEAPSWRLLLQFSSDDGLNWGDNDYFSVFIEKELLAQREFSNCQAVIAYS